MAPCDGFIMPSEEFVGLNLGEIIPLSNVEYSDSETGSADEIDKVMVREVHGCPPYPHDIGT
jgi:hypothetical protein